MKKIISLLVVLGIVFSALPFCTFAEEVKTVDDEVFGLLSALEIVNESDIENADAPVSRGEFIKYLAGAYGLKLYMADEITASAFYDVSTDHPYAREINMAYNAKLINGYGDKSFKPDENLTPSDMVTFLVTMLGYSYHANASGGYPTGYSLIGNQLGLYKGVSISGSTVSKADALKMVFNALNTNIMSVGNIVLGSDDVTLTKGETLMYTVFGVGKAEGVMEANDLTWIKTGGDINPFRVVIDGSVYEVGYSGAENYLGYHVTAYYKYDEYIGENTILYITETRNRNESLTIDVKDLVSIKNGTVSYVDENFKTETVKYDTGAAIIYNGSATAFAFNESLIPEGHNGTVKLLSNDGGDYNVIFVDVYKDYYVTEVNYKEYIIYEDKDKMVLDQEIEEPYCDIYNSKGEPVDFSEIQRYSVVSVYESKSDAKQKYIRAYVSNAKLRGVVKEIHNEDGVKTLKIGEEYYSFEDEYIVSKFNSLIIGRSYEFALNYKGKLDGVRALSSDNSMWGYIVTGRVVGNENTEQSVKIKIYTQLGAFEVYEFNTKIIIDGVPYKDKPYEALSHIENSSFKTFGIEDCYAQLVKFETNDMEKITKIDTILLNATDKMTRSDADTDNLVFSTDMDSVYYTSGERTFSGKAVVSAQADVFTVVFPAKDADGNLKNDYLNEDNYNIVGINSLHTGTITAKAYYESKNSIQASALVLNSSGDKGETSSDRFSIVKKITESVDKDGNPCYSIYAYQDGSEIKLTAPKDLTFADESNPDAEGNPQIKSIFELDAGDIFMYTTNEKTGLVKSLLVYYYSDVKKMTTANKVNSNFTATRRFIEGTVYEKYDDGFSLALTNDVDNIATANMEYYIKPTCAIIVYDSETGRISGGSFNEMESYLLASENASRLVIHMNQVLLRAIFIIK